MSLHPSGHRGHKSLKQCYLFFYYDIWDFLPDLLYNVGKTIINHPFGTGLYHLPIHSGMLISIIHLLSLAQPSPTQSPSWERWGVYGQLRDGTNSRTRQKPCTQGSEFSRVRISSAFVPGFELFFPRNLRVFSGIILLHIILVGSAHPQKDTSRRFIISGKMQIRSY